MGRTMCRSTGIALVILVAAAVASGHHGEVHGAGLPIDPAAKIVLTYILVGLSVVQFVSIMIGLGSANKNSRAARAMLWTHRINGFLFAAWAIFIAQFCIRLLPSYGVSESPVALHVLTAIPVVLIPLMKIVITTWFKGWDSLLPSLGIGTFLLTWITSWLIIVNYYFG